MEIINWLLEGDPAIRYQVMRDLTDANETEITTERKKISQQGWGAKLLSFQDPKGTWSNALYSPKWISTTYSMLLLRRLGMEPNEQTGKACHILMEKGFYKDGGINLFPNWSFSETCVTALVLAILTFFGVRNERLHRVAEFLLEEQMKDGGWNCLTYKGATHGSFHTTLMALEGLLEYEKAFPQHPQCRDTAASREKGLEFLLIHRLFRSHRTGEIVSPRMLRFPFPPRWFYDILRALDYAQECNAPRDERFTDAIEIVKKKRKKDGLWKLHSPHSGRVFFEMEKAGQPSRWNTLRALRVLKWWEPS